MANLKEVFSRIKGVKSTQKTLRAMQMISASDFKKTQKQLVEANNFSLEIKENLQIALASGASINSKQALADTELILIIGGDRGLCGPFNNNLMKAASPYLGHKMAFVGNKIFKLLSKQAVSVLHLSLPKNKQEGIMQIIRDELAPLILKFGKVKLIYTKFQSARFQVVEEINLWPIVLPTILKESEFTFEYLPEITEYLTKTYLESMLYAAILNSIVSESFMRMMAMDNANKNANDMLTKLTLIYNSTRQYKVTTDIVEIISSAGAL